MTDLNHAGTTCRICGEPYRDHMLGRWCRSGTLPSMPARGGDWKLLALLGAIWLRDDVGADTTIDQLHPFDRHRLWQWAEAVWTGRDHGNRPKIIGGWPNGVAEDLARNPDDDRHGSVYGWRTGYCRCLRCIEAGRAERE